MSNELEIEPFVPGRRRRYSPEQKRPLLEEAAQPGVSISIVARRHGIAPSVMFLWRRAMDDDEGGTKAFIERGVQ
ncbi:MAG: transposase [Deltaproteobacteria bacterium]|nr:transposase [Deltaproteobacteria bacterium]